MNENNLASMVTAQTAGTHRSTPDLESTNTDRARAFSSLSFGCELSGAVNTYVNLQGVEQSR